MKSRSQVEDSSSQAGWMFADLFLALTVIFLATVSFIPSGGNGSVNQPGKIEDQRPGYQIQDQELALISNGFIGQYSAGSTLKFISDLKSYFKIKEIPSGTSALFLEVIGNTSEIGVANNAGNLDALKFVINLRKEIPAVLVGTNTSINLSPDVMPGNVRVKITFT